MTPEPASAWKDSIIDHSQFPRSHRELDSRSHEGKGDNPLCGDRVLVQLQVDESGLVTDIACVSVGCAISIASASMLAASVKGKTVHDAERLFIRVREMLTVPAEQVQTGEMGELEALQLVRQYPSRVKCATLAWHALHKALSGSDQPATTE